MNKQPLESLFIDWRHSGDSSRLAEVYDRCAGKLLVAASHLCRDIDQAEELVQGTFLQVLQHADRWDSSRPLEPWLLGILSNLAARSRRAARAEPTPDVPDVFSLDDPVAVATGAEFDAAIDAAIDELPEVYRPVLVLRLKHGMEPGAIAHALRRAPATVRSQLARGLEQMRGRLAAGFAASLALLITPSTGLGAIKARVLAQAAHDVSAGLTLGNVGFGGIVMGTKAWISVFAVAVLALLIWQAQVINLIEESSAVEISDSRAALVNLPVDGRGKAELDTHTARSPMIAIEDSRTARCIGRVVDQGGHPVTGVKIVLTASGGARADAEYLKTGEVFAWEARQLQTTQDGRFEFRGVPPPFHRFDLVIEKPGLITMRGRFENLAFGQIHDCGDVIVSMACEVRGVVLDQDGQPVSGCSLLFTRPSASLASSSGKGDQPPVSAWRAFVRTASDGSFATRALAPSSAWALTIEGRTIESAQGCEVSKSRSRKGKASERGEAFFALSKMEARRDLAIRVGPDTGRSRSRLPGQGQRAGAVAGVDGEVLVLVEGTEEPVEDYSLRLLSHPLSKNPRLGGVMGAVHARGTHAGGLAQLRGVRPGRYLLKVYPRRSGLAPSHLLDIELSETSSRVTVYVGVAGELTVAVRDRQGSPVAGALVQLLESTRGTDVGMGTALIWEGREGGLSNATNYAYRWCEALSDADGLCKLHGPRNVKLAVRLPGSKHRIEIVNDVELGLGGRQRVITVSRGAEIYGRLGPARVVQQLFSTQLKSVNSQRARLSLVRSSPETEGGRPDRVDDIKIGPDGRFSVAGLGAGTWKVNLSYGMWGSFSRVGGGVRGNPSRASLGSIVGLGADEQREQNFDLARLWRVPFAMQLSLNGKPLPFAFLRLTQVEGGPAEPRNTAIVTNCDSLGLFRGMLHPGSYQMSVKSLVGEFAGLTHSHLKLEVLRDGAELRVDIDLGHLDLRVLGSHGEAAARVMLLLPGATGRFLVTDTAGFIRKVQPAGWYRIMVMPPHLVRDVDRRAELYHSLRAVGGESIVIRSMVEVGQVLLVAGETAKLTVQLPD